ncbi:MAG: RNA polymerase sigma factor [Salibacteraceae bacterium]
MGKSPPHANLSRIAYLRSDNPSHQREIFTYFYKESYPGIQKWILSNSGSEEDAEDTFQEGLIELTLGVRKNKTMEEASLEAYLFSIVKNLWFKQLRSRKRLRKELKEDQIEPWMSENQAKEDHSESLATVRAQLREMGSECQEILHLFYFERWSMEEIRAHYRLGSVQAAKNKKARCLCRLRDLCGLFKELKNFQK